MRITKISVKGLFGMFDHEIPLNQESRITILHGPNGVGKTVLLSMLNGLFKLDFILFSMIRFAEFRVDFESGEAVIATKQGDTGKITISYKDVTGARQGMFTPKRISALPQVFQSERRYHKQKDRWRKEDHLSKIANESIYVLFPAIRDVVFGKLPGWFKRIRNDTRASVVQTHRLDQGAQMTPYYGILLLPSVVMGLLAIRLKGWQVISTAFEGLLLSSLIVVIPIAVIILILYVLSSDFRRLIDASRSAVWPLSDTLAKRRIAGETLEQEVMFKSLVNNRFNFKTLEEDGEHRYIICGNDSKPIEVWLLSSGEKQLLHIYHHLLFDVEPDTLVIIDEPELSLHVDWQEVFLEDVHRIVKLRNIDLLIATHSPTLIDDKWEWTVGLGFPDSEITE